VLTQDCTARCDMEGHVHKKDICTSGKEMNCAFQTCNCNTNTLHQHSSEDHALQTTANHKSLQKRIHAMPFPSSLQCEFMATLRFVANRCVHTSCSRHINTSCTFQHGSIGRASGRLDRCLSTAPCRLEPTPLADRCGVVGNDGCRRLVLRRRDSRGRRRLLGAGLPRTGI
jgi:hypothetical protein